MEPRTNQNDRPMLTNEVHVWLTNPADVRDPGLLCAYHALMNAAERRKHDRYRLPKNRHACLLTRALVRTTLSRYAPDVDPAAWEFVEVANGRPELAAGQSSLPLRFNVSRTDGLIACAVTLGHAVGVDVESTDVRRGTSAIAARCFAPTELRDLQAHPAERFYTYWTLKEAYVKARGVGLSVPLNQFAFHMDSSGPIRITFDSRVPDDPARWQFAVERPTERHVLALAIERCAASDLWVRIRSVVPLRP